MNITKNKINKMSISAADAQIPISPSHHSSAPADPKHVLLAPRLDDSPGAGVNPDAAHGAGRFANIET